MHPPDRLRRCGVLVVTALAAALLLTTPVSGSEPASAPDSGDAAPLTDIRDVLRRLRHRPPAPADSAGAESYRRRTVIVTPFLNYNPVTSLIVGLGAVTSIFHGDPQSTFPSTVQAGASVSLEKQVSVSAKLDYYADSNRWFFQANPSWAIYPQSTYDLGTESSDSSKVGVDLRIPKLVVAVYRQVLPDLYAGLGLQYLTHNNIGPLEGFEPRWDTSEFVEYSREHGFDLETQTSAGVSANLLIDRRDNPVNAAGGWFANASFRAYLEDFLGGSSNWQELYLDLRTYRRLDRQARHKLALWLYSDLVTGGVAPYFDLPATGAVVRGRAGRGYDGNRFRGQRMAYAELEYRATLTANGLVGAVVFLNTESFDVAGDGQGLFHSFATAAGTGLRILMDKRAKSNLCLDVGFGKNGSSGLWAGFQEAF